MPGSPAASPGIPDSRALVPLNKENHEVLVKSKDMDDALFQDLITVGTEALEKLKTQQEQAAHIKQHFDKRYSPVWHCIVGKSFGSFVTHEEKGFAYVYIGGSAVLLFKSG